MARDFTSVGVIGLGTMGAGIAQLACQAGARTLLYDPFPEALEKGIERIRRRLKEGPGAALLEPAESIELFTDCDVVL